MSKEYYEIGPKVNDIDFYIGADIVHVISFINTSVTTSATKVVVASSSINVSTSSTFAARKIITASSEAEIQFILETVPLSILQVLTEVHILPTVSVSALKITKASASSNSILSSSTSAIKQTSGDSYISISSSFSPIVKKIAKAIIQSNIVSTSGFSSISILSFRSQVSIKSRVILNPPIRFSPSYIDESSIRTLLILDGKPLTNHQRELNVSLSPVFIENSNWNNKKTRYYKRATSAGRKTFAIKWGNLPNAMDDTVDHRHGRDYIHSIAEDPDSHELKIINQNENGLTPYTETTYTVFIKDYSETLVRRYISEGVYLYECNLTLEEA